jgi:hypothetical protein
MATTLTTRLNFKKQEQGDLNWHTDLNAGLDDADSRLFQAGATTPVGNVTPHFAGQYYHETANDVMWFAYDTTDTDWKRVNEVIVDTAANIQALNATQFKHLLAYATDDETLYVSYDDGGYAWVEIPFSVVQKSWSDSDQADNADQEAASANTREDIDGGLAGALGVSIAVPNDGRDYEIVVVANIAYHVDHRYMGFWLVENDGSDTRVDRKLVNHQGADEVTGEASLSYLQDNPTNNTTYTYRVQFAASEATSNRCVVNPSAAGAFGHADGHFSGATSWSTIRATIKPRRT